jgi:cytochrome c oxidase cbb3-type subunit 3
VSDFVHDGWSIFIAASTVIGLVACLVLLAIASRRKVVSNDNTTGHVWDGDLVELNNPLPRWWMVLFVITVLFSGAYLVLYPGLGNMAGTLGWTSTSQYETEQAKAQVAMSAVIGPFATMSAEQLAGEPRAMAIGERLFINNCATCHGSDARGSKGFPNLTDGDWLYGGSPEKIEETITQGRQGVMPPMAAAVGSSTDVRNLANFVLSLSDSPHNSIAAQLGKAKFTACAACHGMDGKGNPALGAPNLTDKVWLHGWGEELIVTMVNQGKTNVMPSQAGRLAPEQIHLLAAYVWSLSQPTRTASK